MATPSKVRVRVMEAEGPPVDVRAWARAYARAVLRLEGIEPVAETVAEPDRQAVP